MKLAYAAAAALTALCLSTPASAATTVLTFDEFAQAGTGLRYLPSDASGLQYGGLAFKSPNINSPFISWRSGSPQNADPDGATFGHNWSGTLMEISKADGSLFDLVSLELADLFNVGFSVNNTFEFKFGDGTTEAFTYNLDSQPGLQLLTLNRQGLKSFTMKSTSGQWFQMDNLTYADPVVIVPGGVPEPATWAMMILGFATSGALLRRRRTFAAI